MANNKTKHDFEKSVKDELAVLYRVARRMGCSQEEAEDLVQTTLLKAYKAWHQFDGTHLRSWLIRILRNERLMILRSAKETYSLDDETANEVPTEPFWNELAWKLQAGQVLTELEKIPEVYRLVLHLCDVEDMSYEEVATTMDIPIGTVRSRLFRARQMLRVRLEPYIGSEVGGKS